MAKETLAVVVLAAGLGTRMRSARPKVLHAVAGRPLIGHVLAAVAGLRPSRPVPEALRMAPTHDLVSFDLDGTLVDTASEIAEASRPFPGVVPTLGRLRAAGLRLAVCTNKPALPTGQLLAALDLAQHFAAVAAGDVPARKPDPRHLTGVVEQLGASLERTVMVGDSVNDVAAARAAGVPVIAVTFGYTLVPAVELGADAVIESFEELLPLLGLA